MKKTRTILDNIVLVGLCLNWLLPKFFEIDGQIKTTITATLLVLYAIGRLIESKFISKKFVKLVFIACGISLIGLVGLVLIIDLYTSPAKDIAGVIGLVSILTPMILKTQLKKIWKKEAEPEIQASDL